MEFSRRGQATGGAGNGHRFPDPPAHGEREPMLLTRDALLSQLHMACLRHEIIEADLAKIERAMVLPQQTTPVPLPWLGVATADAGRSKAGPFNAMKPVAQQNADLDDPKLLDSNRDALLSQLYMARLRQETTEAELAKIERAMALCTANGVHQTLTMPMPMPWHGVATGDAGPSNAGPFRAEQPVTQHNADFVDCKPPDSNKAVPPSKTLPVAKLELTGITMPKLPMKWSYNVCHVQATSEHNLQQHYVGQKHLSNVATLDPTTKACGQMAKTTVKPSLDTEQKKISSLKWRCSTCQANGICQSTLDAHIKGKRHQQNTVAATSVEGDTNGKPKNAVAQEAESHSMATADAGRLKARLFTAEQPVAQLTAQFDDRRLPDSNKAVSPSKASHVEKWELTGITTPVKKLKPPMKWNCTVCQVQATCEQNLQQHYAGQKHLSNIATLDPTTMASGQMVKPTVEPSLGTEQKKTSPIKWSCSTCQANGICQSTLEAHLKGKRHQQNIVAATNAAEPSLGTEQKKTSSIKWSCSTCQANGICQSTLESHLKGKRHQQNTVAATSVEWDKNGILKNVVAQKAESHSINMLKLSEKPSSVWSCSICQVVCTCQTDLKTHLKGIRHRETVQSLLEQSKNKASGSESEKSEMNTDSRWICGICHALFTCESDAENHLAGHQMYKIKQESNNPPQLVKNKEPTSEWNCAMCEAKCKSKSQFEAHCGSNLHQQKIHAILRNGNLAKVSSSRIKSEVPPDGSNTKNASPEKAVKQPILYFCEVCSLLFESSTMLVHHRFGKKHRAKLSARNEPS